MKHLFNCECILCNELANKDCLSQLLNRRQSMGSKFLAETESFALIPDISPIVPGHLLIVTKIHCLSFAEIADSAWHELEQIKAVAKKSLSNFSIPPFFFEHGSSNNITASTSCIEHAHLHVIPFNARGILAHLARFSSTPLSAVPIRMEHALPRTGSDYLYYEAQDSTGCVIVDPKKPLPHQFIRRFVAKKGEIPEWNWQVIFSNLLQEDRKRHFC